MSVRVADKGLKVGVLLFLTDGLQEWQTKDLAVPGVGAGCRQGGQGSGGSVESREAAETTLRLESTRNGSMDYTICQY